MSRARRGERRRRRPGSGHAEAGGHPLLAGEVQVEPLDRLAKLGDGFGGMTRQREHGRSQRSNALRRVVVHRGDTLPNATSRQTGGGIDARAQARPGRASLRLHMRLDVQHIVLIDVRSVLLWGLLWVLLWSEGSRSKASTS